jgi:hypothetical protein
MMGSGRMLSQQLLIPSARTQAAWLCPAYVEDESDDGSGKDMTTTEAT